MPEPIDERARIRAAAQALAEISDHLDPAVVALIDLGSTDRISILLYHAVPGDGAALAGDLGLALFPEVATSKSGRVHHVWAGLFGGHRVEITVIEDTAGEPDA
jgi:hypothetical protein